MIDISVMTSLAHSSANALHWCYYYGIIYAFSSFAHTGAAQNSEYMSDIGAVLCSSSTCVAI